MYDDKLIHPPKAELERIINELPESNILFEDIAKIGRSYNYPKCDDAFNVSANAEEYVKDIYSREGNFTRCSIPQLVNAIFFQLRRMNHTDTGYRDITGKELEYYRKIALEIKTKLKDYQ